MSKTQKFFFIDLVIFNYCFMPICIFQILRSFKSILTIFSITRCFSSIVRNWPRHGSMPQAVNYFIVLGLSRHGSILFCLKSYKPENHVCCRNSRRFLYPAIITNSASSFLKWDLTLIPIFLVLVHRGAEHGNEAWQFKLLVTY